MKHKRHRNVTRLEKRLKKIAVAVAGATVLAGAMQPSLPATVHAAANPNAAKAPTEATQQVKDAQSKTAIHDQVANAKHAKAPDNYKKVLNIKATAYAPGPHDNDQWGDKTFLGTTIRPSVIAVDPNVIALGSRVYIQYPDGHGEYAVAEDTGGAIKGNRIDIAKTSVSKAQDFGIQNVKVYVLHNHKNA